MNGIFQWAWLLAVLSCFAAPAQGVCASFVGKVVAVDDGDSIRVLQGKKEVKISLWGIDAPELGQAFGEKSKQALSGMVFGKQVTVVVHDKDRHGGTVAEIVTADGVNVNAKLVEEGMAWWYRQYAKDATSLRELFISAQVEKRGLWEHKSPVPPWRFRRNKESGLTCEDLPGLVPAVLAPNAYVVFLTHNEAEVRYGPTVSTGSYTCKEGTGEIVTGSGKRYRYSLRPLALSESLANEPGPQDVRDPSREKVCAEKRGVCTMEYNPVTCTVTLAKSKKTIEVKGSNRCAGIDNAKYQACLAEDEIVEEKINCRAAAGEGE